jgi:drug/metabolite transporter (DMT)-like permease
MSRALRAHILLALVTVVWGATFVVIKEALADISPLLFNAVRMGLAALLMAAIYRRELTHFTRGSVRAGVVVGILLWLGYEFQTTGLRLTTPSKSGFLTGVSVVLVPLVLAVGWKRHINRWTLGGVAAAFVGLYLLTVPATDGWGLAQFASVNRGDLLTLGCALVFAFHIILLGRATQAYRFQQIAVLQLGVCVLLMTLTVPLVETVYVTWTPRVLWAIAITGILGTAAAFTIQAWAQQFTPPTHTALIFALEPVFAWLTSYLVLGERLGGRAAVGAVLILAGVLISELKGSAARPREELGPAEGEVAPAGGE